MILHKHTAFTFDKKSHSHSRQWKTKRCSGGCRRDSDSASSTPPPWSSSAVTVPCRIYPLRFCLSKPNRPSSPTPTQCLIRAARHPNLQPSNHSNLITSSLPSSHPTTTYLPAIRSLTQRLYTLLTTSSAPCSEDQNSCFTRRTRPVSGSLTGNMSVPGCDF